MTTYCYHTGTLIAEPILEHGSSEYGYSFKIRRNETGAMVGRFICGYDQVYFFDAIAGAFRQDELIDLATLIQRINENATSSLHS